MRDNYTWEYDEKGWINIFYGQEHFDSIDIDEAVEDIISKRLSGK